MANPKNRHSRTRRNMRRTHWKLKLQTLSVCSHCHEPKLAHRVCPSCGYYDGRQVMETAEAK
ncbi:MAG TPA: 50S ribosomal protein L32 [Bacillota bacterium]